jgi:hypothetical protein
MISRKAINPNRMRRISGSFSWIDHRLLSHGFIAQMAPEEMLLYFFLVLVGDKNGISFYSYDKICALLKMDVDRFIGARNRLCDRSLIAVKDGVFQVLSLPQPVALKPKIPPTLNRWEASEIQSLKQIFQRLGGNNLNQ